MHLHALARFYRKEFGLLQIGNMDRFHADPILYVLYQKFFLFLSLDLSQLCDAKEEELKFLYKIFINHSFMNGIILLNRLLRTNTGILMLLNFYSLILCVFKSSLFSIFVNERMKLKILCMNGKTFEVLILVEGEHFLSQYFLKIFGNQ